MAEPLLIALDQGTTSTRAIAYDLAGRERARAARPLAQSYPAPGWVEHDPEEIAAASLAVLREALDRAGGEPLALGIANQRETTVVWDRSTGRAIAPAIVWQDRRTAPQCEALRARGLEPEIAERTGLRLDPYFSATKIAWLLDAIPRARARAEAGELAFGTVDSWLVWRLTGGAVHATDATNASRTMLFDLGAGAWCRGLCDLFGVPWALLPEVRDTASDFGTTTPEALGRALPIGACVGDQQAALAGHGCLVSGALKATYGTGAFLLLHTGERRARSASGLLASVASRLNGRDAFALEGAVFSAGAAVQWAAEALGLKGGPAEVERLAARAAPGHGVVLVPAFTGLGAPWWDSRARGAILGLTRDAGAPEIAAAALDSAAHQTGDLIEAMRADAPEALSGRPLRIDGGMAAGAGFAQRLADLTGVEVARSTYGEATALGAALLAGVGAGVFASPEAGWPPPDAERFQPRLAAAARADARALWLEAVGRVTSRPAG